MVAAEIAGAKLTDADISEMFKLRGYFRAIVRGEFRHNTSHVFRHQAPDAGHPSNT